MRNSVGVVVMASCLWFGVVAAQPFPTSSPPDTGATRASGTTTIPISGVGDTEVLAAETAASSSAPGSVALEEPIDPRTYLCGAGDLFELNFWGQQNFRLRVAADLEGRVFISKVGFVSVTGKTLADVRALVAKKVRGNYPGLNFELVLVTPRTFLVHVVDNVKQPGAYEAHPLDRVGTVLSRAGGSTGSRRRITIKHKTGPDTRADLVRYEQTGDTSLNPYVLDGDVIRVPVVETKVAIAGAVYHPGAYELTETKNLSELVALAGGLNTSVARTLPIRIVRRNAEQRDITVEVPFTGSQLPDAPLMDNDRVIIRGNEDLQRSVLVIGAVANADTLDAATSSRRLPYVEGDTVLSLIERAGGVAVQGDLDRAYISRPQPSGPPKLIPVSLEQLLVKRDFSADRPVMVDDTIVVPAMQHSIRVEGAVARSGLYPFNPKFGMSEYIAHAGGRTRTAQSMSDVKLIDRDGRTRSYRADLKPEPGDAILVPERTFTRPEIVQIAIATAGVVLSGVAIALAASR